jgi:hypothetical protein
MSKRNFIVVVFKMLEFVPAEEDDLKRRLTKLMEAHPYKADEIQINSWIETQDCLENRFGEIKINEMPEWVSKMLNVWKNIEQ